MTVESYIYSLDDVISLHTNKPCTDEEVSNEKGQVNLWCEVCQRLLNNVSAAVQHVYGKSHRSKLNTKNAIIPSGDDKNIPNGQKEGAAEAELGAENLNSKKKRRKRKGKQGQGLEETNPSVSADNEPLEKKIKEDPSNEENAVIPSGDDQNIPNGQTEAEAEAELGVESLNGKKKRRRKRKGKQGQGLEETSQSVPGDNEPLVKKIKEDPPNEKNGQENGAKEEQKTAEDNKCDDCDIVFRFSLDALNHFKGKRHMKKIRSLAMAREESRKLQANDTNGTNGTADNQENVHEMD